MPPVITLGCFSPPCHYMCEAATNLVITSGAPVDLDGPGADNRLDHILVPVWTDLHPLLERQRPQRLLPALRAATTSHATQANADRATAAS